MPSHSFLRCFQRSSTIRRTSGLLPASLASTTDHSGICLSIAVSRWFGWKPRKSTSSDETFLALIFSHFGSMPSARRRIEPGERSRTAITTFLAFA